MASTQSTRRGPEIRSLRLLAGVSAGIVGGLAFGLIMIAQVISRVSALNSIGFLPWLIDSTSGISVWSVHIGVSAVLGLGYALLVSTRSFRANLALGALYGVAVFFATGVVIVSTSGGSLLDFDRTVLVGHFLFGATVGLVYPAVWREELAMVASGAAAEHAH
jgi:hypothetical protein